MAVLGGCGRPICLVSTGMNEEATFGVDGPDEHGYFTHPCQLCAVAWKTKYPKAKVQSMANPDVRRIHCERGNV